MEKGTFSSFIQAGVDMIQSWQAQAALTGYLTKNFSHKTFFFYGNEDGGPSKDNPFPLWNTEYYRKARNCYAFACDLTDPERVLMPGKYIAYVPSPGGIAGKRFESFSAVHLADALVRDGFIALPSSEDHSGIRIPDDRHLVAGFFGRTAAEIGDYHFYRYHPPSRTWFHKLWRERAFNIDKSYKHIMNPREAERGIYTHFFGYFLSPPKGLKAPFCLIKKSKKEVVYYRGPVEYNPFVEPSRRSSMAAASPAPQP